MIPPDPVLVREIPVIRKIIQDETWLEGERRGCRVLPDDAVVREKVCQVILRVGRELRESITSDFTPGCAVQDTVTNATPPVPDDLVWEI
jgi:hypothetical protein